MKNKNTNPDAYFERMRELAAVNKQVVKESKSTSTLLEYKKAGDGRLYGIVKENQAYFIKTAQSKKEVSEADFAYIGGLSNITEYKCGSLTEAQRVLNTKVMTVNETYGGMMEDEQEEEMPQAEPEAAPAPEPQPEGEPMPEPQAEPAPEPQPEAEPQGHPEPEKHELHSVISSAAGEFSAANNLEPSKVEYYLKQFLGVIKDSQLAKLDDEQKQAIYDQYFNGQNVEESISLTEDMDSQTIEMIVAGIGALASIGLGFAIDPLKKLLLKTRVGKKVVDELENAGSAAGDETRGGMSKGKFESYDHLTESDIFEDAELKDDEFEGDDELSLDVPEMEDEVEISGMDSSVGGGKNVKIDLKSGTVDINLSEGKIKQLAKKYNVSESYIKWKMNDILKEETEKIEKEKLQEEKVRKVVRNIIKEKLGLKKKSLTESVSKERAKLEKLVESVLKKNM